MGSYNLPPTFTTDDNSLSGNLFIATIAAVLLSFAGFQGWLKLFLIGAIFETCRRVHAWGSIVDSFWITVDINDFNRSHDMMLLWLSRHPMLERGRRCYIRDSAPGLESSADNIGNQGNDRKVHFLLAWNHVYTFWHKWRYIRATRSTWRKMRIRTSRWSWSERSRNQSLNLSILGGGRWIVDDLLAEAKECWKRAREEQTSIYVPDQWDNWRLIASRPRRLLDSIILDSGVKEDALHDARDFLDSKKWYSERGIPFRRGYLLHGAPGCGKTSLVRSLAGELNLDVYIISLSRTGLDDDGLREVFSELPRRCIALMDDIDVAFHDTSKRELPDEGRALEEIKGLKRDRSGRVSLSGLLNVLDGVGAQEGRLLIVTTNRLEAVDPALRRPGRIDYLIDFKLASQYQAGELFKKFYLPNSRSSTQRPLSKDPATYKDENGDRRTVNPRYGTPVEPEAGKLVDVESPTRVRDKSHTAFARRKKHDVELSPEQLEVLVEQFRESIPEREFSMGGLQGYLLTHKDQPHRAVECASKWVEEEMAKRGSG